MSATTQLAPDGIYTIMSAWSGSCVAFTDDTSSPRLQNCDVNSSQQQWELQALSDDTYSLKNLAYGTYIAPIIPVHQFSYLQQSLAPYTWYLNNASQYIYTLAPDNTFSLGWDIQNIIEGNPVSSTVYIGPLFE
ncbi:hypothetical protein L210DRAFT_573827 [Boletus edulis BED1]|uniref:Ricin B lectin domain-containing protein n=1 Tax=Boletus edulis BED1 TaxID=1328754 RepID=A0AAD4GNK2_BOLED|nr:hypothetical protein L210DRAFT_573827 [Boletus edulis BED1]